MYFRYLLPLKLCEYNYTISCADYNLFSYSKIPLNIRTQNKTTEKPANVNIKPKTRG